MSVFLC